jgi:polysaccharide biosynthesis/export protein
MVTNSLTIKGSWWLKVLLTIIAYGRRTWASAGGVVIVKVGVSMRFIVLFICACLLSACVDKWEANSPLSPPGGTGLQADGILAEGPDAFSSVSRLPPRNQTGPLPPFGTRGTAAAYEYKSGYRVGAGDKLSIRVAGEADLTGEFPVDPSGAISLPYVQSATVAGMSTPQIEKMIAARLRNGFLKNPIVSVQVTALRPFYIMGEVTAAGSFPYQPGITVQNAIAIAGGYAARADKTQVLLTRRDATGTHTSKVPITTQIYPGDIVYIRERWF